VDVHDVGPSSKANSLSHQLRSGDGEWDAGVPVKAIPCGDPDNVDPFSERLGAGGPPACQHNDFGAGRREVTSLLFDDVLDAAQVWREVVADQQDAESPGTMFHR
jgi:hypothetical protein